MTTALFFGNNVSDRVVIGSQAAYDNMQIFSVLAWIRPATLATGKTWASKQTGSNTLGWRMQVDSAGGHMNVRRTRVTTALNCTTNNNALVADVWRCVVIIVDITNSVVQIWSGDMQTPISQHTYSTQTLGSGSASTGAGSDAAQSLYIGNDSGNDTSFGGDIGAVTILTRVVTQAEMDAWMANPRSLDSDGNCVWTAELDNATTVNDVSSQNNDGTVTGATVTAGYPTKISGTGAATMDAADEATTGTLKVSGTGAATMDAADEATTGTLKVSGTLDATMDAGDEGTTGTVGLPGTLDATLGAADSAGDGDVTGGAGSISGTGDATMEGAAAAGTGQIKVAGTAAVTVEVAAAATGGLRVTGAGDLTLAALDAAALANLVLRGSLDATLAAGDSAGDGVLRLPGALAAALAVDLASDGLIRLPGSLASALETAVIASVGSIGLSGVVEATLPGIDSIGGDVGRISGTGAAGLAPVDLLADARALVRGALAAVAGSGAVTSVGGLRVAGGLMATVLARVSVIASFGQVGVRGTLAATLPGARASSTTTPSIRPGTRYAQILNASARARVLVGASADILDPYP